MIFHGSELEEYVKDCATILKWVGHFCHRYFNCRKASQRKLKRVKIKLKLNQNFENVKIKFKD